MYEKFLFFIGAALMASGIRADKITVKNESDFDWYVGIYYYQTKKTERSGTSKLIPARTSEVFERPPSKGLPLIGPERYLAFSLNPGDLKEQLTSSEFHLLGNTKIGTEQGTTFYLALEKGHFAGFNPLEWKVVEPLKKKLAGIVDTLDDLVLGQIRRKYTIGPYATMRAAVRQGTSLPPQEIEYRNKRKNTVKAELENFLGMRIADNEVPVIGIAASGGGYRAMLGTAGAAIAAEQLLRCSYYIAGLSGGTWFIGPWMQSGLTPSAFAATIPPKITRDFVSAPADVVHLFQSLLMRFAFKQPLSPVNIFGRLLAVNIMTGIKNGLFNTYLSDQAEMVKDGKSIFPIYTAVATKLPYQWVEFTPYEMGGDYFGGYIPMWAFGAPFLDGQQQYYTPPFNLHYILAITGSAFAARLSQALGLFEKKIPIEALRKALVSGAEELSIGKYRIAAAKVFNWTYGMKSLPRAQHELISLVDAGIAYNLPLEALLRRKVDFLLILDFSDAEYVGQELEKAEKELRARGFALPPIEYKGLENNNISVFKDPRNPAAPTILYIPLIKNARYPALDPNDCMKTWCGTFSLSYPEDKSNLLMQLTKRTMEDVLPVIKQELRAYVQNKRKK